MQTCARVHFLHIYVNYLIGSIIINTFTAIAVGRKHLKVNYCMLDARELMHNNLARTPHAHNAHTHAAHIAAYITLANMRVHIRSYIFIGSHPSGQPIQVYACAEMQRKWACSLCTRVHRI